MSAYEVYEDKNGDCIVLLTGKPVGGGLSGQPTFEAFEVNAGKLGGDNLLYTRGDVEQFGYVKRAKFDIDEQTQDTIDRVIKLSY